METSLTGKALDFGSREYGFESRVSKHMIENRYSYIFNQLQISSRGKRYSFNVRVTTAVKPVLRLLQTLNLIRRFHRSETGSNIYRVFPSYSRFRRSCRLLRVYARKRGRISLSYNSLRLLNYNSPHSYYILETPRGIVTHKDAIKHRHGGLLLAIIH